MDGGAPPIPELCDHKSCQNCWTGYPESRFPNWTSSQVKKSRIADAVQEEQSKSCISYHVDIDSNGYFRNADKFIVEPGTARETWQRMLNSKVSDVGRREIQWLSAPLEAPFIFQDQSYLHKGPIRFGAPNAGD